MANNYGKQFEKKFYSDFINTVKDSFILRLYDQVSGYKNVSKNLCDYICYCEPLLYLIEVKSVKGNTFPIGNLTQYDKLKEKVGIKGVRAGAIIWFYEKDKVVYVPCSTFTKLIEDGKKSVNIKMLNEGMYRIIEIPSKKKRVFMDSDYSVLMNLEEGD